jgi:hypothetical protein
MEIKIEEDLISLSELAFYGR